MKKIELEILEELRLALGEKCFNEYLKIKDFYKDKQFKVKAWLDKDAIEFDKYESVEIAVSLEDALLSAIDCIKNDNYTCSEIALLGDDELDFIFEAMIENGAFKCNFTSIVWRNCDSFLTSNDL